MKRKIKGLLCASVMALSLSSCSALDLIKPSPGLSVDTEITAGDKNQTAEVAGHKEVVTADTINKTYNTVNKRNYWDMIIFSVVGWIVGWITKTPYHMWQLIKDTFTKKGNPVS